MLFWALNARREMHACVENETCVCEDLVCFSVSVWAIAIWGYGVYLPSCRGKPRSSKHTHV